MGCCLSQDLEQLAQGSFLVERGLSNFASDNKGLRLAPSLRPTCDFIFELGLFPLILFPSLEIKPERPAVGALRGFEATR